MEEMLTIMYIIHRKHNNCKKLFSVFKNKSSTFKYTFKENCRVLEILYQRIFFEIKEKN